MVKAKSVLLLFLVVLLSVLIPFLFWRSSWFGTSLGNEDLGRFLQEQEKPRQIQHALAQLGERIIRGDPSARQWYGQLADLAHHPLPEIRTMAAWVMGQEGSSEKFHQTLLGLLRDREVLVRRNAAVALVRFGGAAGRGELVAMLQPDMEPEQVWESLRALYLIGEKEDLSPIESLIDSAQFSERILNQASLTAEVIRKRAGSLRSQKKEQKNNRAID